MKNQADQTPKDNVNTGGTVGSVRGVGSSRRRFIKGGAAAAPVILTFTSRPVLGFEQACMTPSRMISGNHSGFAGPTTCGGSTRAMWAAAAAENPQPDWAKILFTDVFGESNPYDNGPSGGNPKNLGPVLLDSIAGGDKNKNSVAGFASYIIAAYLNAGGVQDEGGVPVVGGFPDVTAVLKPAQVGHMWNDVVGTTAGYCPQLNMCWTANGVIGYLQNSGIVPA